MLLHLPVFVNPLLVLRQRSRNPPPCRERGRSSPEAKPKKFNRRGAGPVARAEIRQLQRGLAGLPSTRERFLVWLLDSVLHYQPAISGGFTCTTSRGRPDAFPSVFCARNIRLLQLAKPGRNCVQKLYTAPSEDACILLLTPCLCRSTISVALNKKSAQKQKVKRVNNGFSQAVVSYKSNKNSTKYALRTTRILLKKRVVFFYSCFTIATTMHDERSVLGLLESGQNGLVVTIECALSNRLPNMVDVGYARAVDEARERIRSAFAASKLELPHKRITINLAPADISKDGSGFDRGLATTILSATNHVALSARF
jgi:hypothetical protein